MLPQPHPTMRQTQRPYLGKSHASNSPARTVSPPSLSNFSFNYPSCSFLKPTSPEDSLKPPAMKSVDALSEKLAGAKLDQTGSNDSSTGDTESSSSVSQDESSEDDSEDEELRRHLKYLVRSPDEDTRKEAALSPIFTSEVRQYARELQRSDGKQHKPLFPQQALLGCEADTEAKVKDNRLYYNVAAPCSIFICGSQGSGKSHTLSCVLEGCLIPSEINELQRPLTGLVFHYDTFISEAGGAPCEAAYLASNPKASVRVLCAPTNLGVIKVRLPRLLPSLISSYSPSFRYFRTTKA